MPDTEIIDINICTDCLVFWANGDLPEDDIEAEAAVTGAVGIDANWTVSPGHHHNLEDCGDLVMDGCADCPYDEGHFSWSPCDACRRHLSGTRYPASTFPVSGWQAAEPSTHERMPT